MVSWFWLLCSSTWIHIQPLHCDEIRNPMPSWDGIGGMYAHDTLSSLLMQYHLFHLLPFRSMVIQSWKAGLEYSNLYTSFHPYEMLKSGTVLGRNRENMYPEDSRPAAYLSSLILFIHIRVSDILIAQCCVQESESVYRFYLRWIRKWDTILGWNRK